MTSGFDRLEKFFNLSRSKGRDLQEKNSTSRKTISVQASYKGPVSDASSQFPSPSFMKPTSSRMQPRDPLYQRKEDELPPTKDKARSQSLPDVKQSLRRLASAHDPLEVGRKTRSYESSRPPSAVNQPSTPDHSDVRFPEDILFRSPEVPSTPTQASPTHIVENSTLLSTPRQEPRATQPRDTQLLDWTPRHMSLMFKNPHEIFAVDEQPGLNSNNDVQDSMILMPSPMFAPPERPPPRSPLRGRRARTPPTPLTTRKFDTHEWEFSTFPPQYSVISSPSCRTYSPSTSDSEDDYTTALSRQSVLTSRSGILSIYSAESSPDTVAKVRRTQTGVARAARETWGSRRQDPMLNILDAKGSPVPNSSCTRTQSAATLSVVSYKIAKEHILQEPKINDIYALSDEDIFETRPLSPAPRLPPPPPPKDEGYVRLHRRTQPAQTVAHTRYPSAPVVRLDQVTPPETPTDTSFLVPMPPSHSAGQRGAIMAASIAEQYNFDLIYLVSLWPTAGGNQMDPSLGVDPQWPQMPAATGGSIYAGPNSTITGRYLAAFGLSQVGEQFRILTRPLLKTLRIEGWKEYDDAAAPFNHGWACSFKSDYMALERQGADAAVLKSAQNRGIVFAAYTRRGNDAAIPKDLVNKRAHLAKLHDDVQHLVDILSR